MHDNERRSHNRKLAIRLAEAGIYVFPSLDKNPIVPGWQNADSSLTAEERASTVKKFIEEHNREPLHVGCTTDVATIKRIWKTVPDAVPSISCGPSRLIVLDCDRPRDSSPQDGVTNVRTFFEDHGKTDLSDLPITNTRSKGRHLYFRNTVEHGCASGAFRSMNIQVKGIGGQIVAPGAVREDGARYEQMTGTPSLIEAFIDGSIPVVPDYVVEHFRTKVSTDKADISNDEQALFERRVEEATLEEYETVYGPLGYGLDALKAKDAEFAALMDAPSGDKSKDRFTLAKCLHREFGDAFTIEDYAALVIGHPDQAFGVEGDRSVSGEFDTRDLVRCFLNSRNSFKIASGEAFGAVVEDDYGSDTPPDDIVEAKQKKERAKSGLPFVLSRDTLPTWKPIRWLIRDLIPWRGVFAIYGESNVGKSFLALDIAERISRGMDFFGMKTKQRGVLYMIGEGYEGASSRVKAWFTHNKESAGLTGDMALITECPNFYSDTRLLPTIARTIEAYKAATGLDVGLIILDTLSTLAAGMDESATGDAVALIAKLQQIVRKYDCAVGFVHHIGKDAGRGIRGSSVFTANVDAKIVVKAEKGKGLSFGPDKQRDGAKGHAHRFDLKRIVLGVDEDGEEATSMVIRDPGADASAAMGAVRDGDGEDRDPSASFGSAGGEGEGEGAAVSADSDSDRFALEAVENDQKARKEADREAMRQSIARAILDPYTPKLNGKFAGWVRRSDLEERIPALLDFVKANTSNFARNFGRDFMYGQSDVMVDGMGRLWIDTPSRKMGMIFRIEPVKKPRISSRGGDH